MKRLAFVVTLCVVGAAAVASADAIQKWRAPDGSLYFGDHPPHGSTLVETYADSPTTPAVTTIPSAETATLSRAAEDGREIIRRRQEERAAERKADDEREARNAEIAANQQYYDDSAPYWFITSTLTPCRFGDCFRGHRQHVPGGHDRWAGAVVSTARPPLRPSPPVARRMLGLNH
jgi:hypothetical protein